MNALLGAVFVASVLGSLHCVGMCGPFALLAGSHGPLPDRKSESGDHDSVTGTSAWLPTVAYSLGRLLSYAAVGAIFGSIGLAMNWGGAISGWQQSATQWAGAIMVLVGIISILRILGFTVHLPQGSGRLQRSLRAVFRFAKGLSPIRRALLIGMSSSLMPCGWLYVFALTAAGTGNPWTGALVMTVFWAGTVPIMVALGLGMGRLSYSIQAKVPTTMALMVIGIGLFTIFFRSPVSLSAWSEPRLSESNSVQMAIPATQPEAGGQPSERGNASDQPWDADQAAARVKAIQQKDLPCCSHH